MKSLLAHIFLIAFWLGTPLALSGLSQARLPRRPVPPRTHAEVRERFAYAGNVGKAVDRAADTLRYAADPAHLEYLKPVINSLQLARFAKLFPHGEAVTAWVESDAEGFITVVSPFAPERIQTDKRIQTNGAGRLPGIGRVALVGRWTGQGPSPAQSKLEGAYNPIHKAQMWKGVWDESGHTSVSDEQAQTIADLLSRTLPNAKFEVHQSQSTASGVMLDPANARVRALLADDSEVFDYDWGLEPLIELGGKLGTLRTERQLKNALASYHEGHKRVRQEMREQLIRSKSVELEAAIAERARVRSDLAWWSSIREARLSDPRLKADDLLHRLFSAPPPKPYPVLARYLEDYQQYRWELAQWQERQTRRSSSPSNSERREPPNGSSGSGGSGVPERVRIPPPPW